MLLLLVKFGCPGAYQCKQHLIADCVLLVTCKRIVC